MRLAKINTNYLNWYNEEKNNMIKDFGLKIYSPEYKLNIFLPITSFKEKHNKISNYDSKYQILADEYNNIAVVRISDYVIIGKYSEELNVKVNSIEQKEFEIIKRNKSLILRKLNDILKNKNHLKFEKNLYDKFELLNYKKTEKFSKNYIKDILYSVTIFENLNVTPRNIESIINLSEEKIEITGHDNSILNSAINAWQWILDTKEHEINLDYITDLNEKIARNQALKVGTLRDSNGGYVHGSSYEPPIPKESEVKQKIDKYLRNSNKLNGALEYFCYATKNQLFYDGNKRTSYLIVNKVLIENGIGVFIINDEYKEEFNIYLNNHYNNSHIDVKYKDELIKFIIDNCIIYE